MKKPIKKSPERLITSVSFVCVVAISLLLFRIISSDSSRYIFMIWNLLLAVVPVFLAWWLFERLKTKPWWEFKQLAITAGWLLFLPNSFYLITDFVHLRQTYEVSLLYDVVLFMSFAIAGLILGYISLYLVHANLEKRVRQRTAWAIVALILFASSFAIYLGRFSRWNTWDVLFQPAGLLFDVSDKFVNPNMHSETYETTLIFLALLLPIYWVMYELVRYLKD